MRFVLVHGGSHITIAITLAAGPSRLDQRGDVEEAAFWAAYEERRAEVDAA